MSIRESIAIATMFAALALCSWSWALSAPQGTAFTYQGVFKQGGAPANGTFHLRFQLWDALAGGAQVGADVDHSALAVDQGLFAVELDFGALAFNGSARWLQAQVVTNGGNTVTTLVPRQPVNATPYALYALKADGPNLTNLNASNLASGTVPSAQLAGTYSNTLTLANPANTFGGTFTGSGASITNLNATNISSGTLSTARLPSGGSWPLTSLIDIDAGTLVVDPVNNRVGIGTVTPSAPLHVRTNVPSLLLQDTASAANQAGFVDFRNVSGIETAWMGFGTAGSPHFSVLNARTGGDVVLQCLGAGGSIRMFPGTSGEVQIGTGTNDPQRLRLGTSATSGFLFGSQDTLTLGYNYYVDPAGVVQQTVAAKTMAGIRMSPTGIAFVVEDSNGGLDGALNCDGFETNIDTPRVTMGGTVLIGPSFINPPFNLNVNGTAGKPGGGSWSTLSDRRLKKNIQPVHNALNDLLALRGVSYEYIDPKSIGERAGTRIGMIAQEVEEVFPDWVDQLDNGYKSLTFRGFEAVTVEALRDLRAEKDAEIARLNDRIDELERLVRESLAGRP